MSETLVNGKNNEIWEMDRRHFVHPWTHFDSFRHEGSLILDTASGVYVTDSDGKRYLDGVGGLWCMNIGYGCQEMVDAITEQATRLAYGNPFVDIGHDPAARLCAKLSELAPGDLNRVMLSCGGSTANDSAFRLIQYYWGCLGQKQRRHFITRKGSYHGSTYIAQSLTGKLGDIQKEFDYVTDIIHKVSEPNMYRRPEGMDEAEFEQFLIDEFEATVREIGPDNVAGFFAEPVLGAGGVIVPPRRYVKEVREICRKFGIIYVSDEVVTGFGRLGHWFVSKDEFGIQPDIIVCAKGLTSGYQPLGATIFSDAIYDVIAEEGHDRLFTNGFTYSAHPVACAAALKNIEIMDRENLLDYVREDVGPYFMERLDTLRDIPIVGDIRGSHLMACVVNVADKETRDVFPPEVAIGSRIARAAEERGLIVRPIDNLNVMSPPLTITRAEVDELVSILHEALEVVVDGLKEEGRL